MLRMNLATRPFYNERAVHLVLGLVALLAVTVIGLGAVRLTALSRAYDTLASAAETDERRAAAIETEAATLQRQTATGDLDALADATREANRLIDRRVFSWTEFLNRVETTLPADVMLTSLRPEIRADGVGVRVGVIARDVDAIVEFIERLETTGAFAELLAREEEITDAGTYRAVLFGEYRQRDPEPSP